LAVVDPPWTKSGGFEANDGLGVGRLRRTESALLQSAGDEAVDAEDGPSLKGAAAGKSMQVGSAAGLDAAAWLRVSAANAGFMSLATVGRVQRARFR
jgi:hypothetical protein